MNGIFKITHWELIEQRKEKKLSKKQRKICKLFDIPIPPRRLHIQANVTIEYGKEYGEYAPAKVYDVILCGEIPYLVVEINKYKSNILIETLKPVWEYKEYIGESAVISSAFAEKQSV